MKILILIMFLAAINLAQEPGENIGIVYDNSGSMLTGHREKPTKYSFELLVSILDANDTLYFVSTRMAKNGIVSPKIFPCENKQAIYEFIDTLSSSKDTYFNSVKSLLNYFSESDHKNKSLVILTDGQFTHDIDDFELYMNNVSENLAVSFGYLINMPNSEERQKILNQNILPQLSLKFNGDKNRGEFAVKNEGYSDLITRITELYSLLSGFSVKSNKKYATSRANKIHINYPLPLKKIRFILQRKDKHPQIKNVNKVCKIYDKQNKLIDDFRNTQVYSTSGRIEFEQIIGPEQSITIELDSSLSSEDFLFVFDHALEEIVTVRDQNDMFIDKNSEGEYFISRQDTLAVTIEYKYKDKIFVFPPELLDSFNIRGGFRNETKFPYNWINSYFISPSIHEFNKYSNNELVKYDLYSELPGFINSHREISFRISDPKESFVRVNESRTWKEILFTTSQCRIDESKDVILSIFDKETDENITDKFSFEIFSSPQQKFSVRTNKSSLNLKLEKSFLPWINRSGLMSFEVKAQPTSSEYKKQKISFAIKINNDGFWCLWFYFLLFILILILLFMKIICFLRSHKFTKTARITTFQKNNFLANSYEEFGDTKSIKKLRSFDLKYYLFCSDMSMVINLETANSSIPLRIKAGKKGNIFIDKNSMKNIDDITIANESLKELSGEGKNDILLQNGGYLKHKAFTYVYTR